MALMRHDNQYNRRTYPPVVRGSERDIIVIEDLVKSYGDRKAVDGLSLSVREGEIFGFLGPNGAGKTTTVRCVSTLTNFDSGTIRVDGVDLLKDPVTAKSRMGIIQQQISLDKDLTVRENMTHHAMCHLMSKKEREPRIAELSETFGLTEYMETPINSLSGGWKKRVAIVCALLHSPKILFLDEPTTGLDTNARRLLWDVVRKLNIDGTTVILTTHYIEEAESLCDRVTIIDHGRVIALDTPHALCTSIGSMAVEYVSDGKTLYRYFATRQEAKDFAAGLDEDSHILIRRTNLEDVFVELTGREAGLG